MGRGTWTRWGRGSCEGYGLAIGDLLRCGARRGLDQIGKPATWMADVNAVELGEFPSRDEAMQRVEERVISSMRDALADWTVFQGRPKRAR
jgi:hypothetical protein